MKGSLIHSDYEKLYYGKNELNVGQSSLIELAEVNCDFVIFSVFKGVMVLDGVLKGVLVLRASIYCI